MIASNQHRQPPLEPGRSDEPALILPDIYLDLMFGEQKPQAERPVSPPRLTVVVLENSSA